VRRTLKGFQNRLVFGHDHIPMVMVGDKVMALAAEPAAQIITSQQFS
jgi:hypothetical protein